MRLGIYVGSFNPPHNGHIDIVNYLLENNYVDEILIVPTQNYWNKQDLVDVKHRINMLRFFESERIHVDSENNDIPYTYLLMKALKEEYSADLHLIIGADNIINFDKWKNYQELLDYKIIIMNRKDVDIREHLDKYDTSNFIVLDDYQSIDVSSTEVRENNNSNQMNPKVLSYIRKNGLYRKNNNNS